MNMTLLFVEKSSNYDIWKQKQLIWKRIHMITLNISPKPFIYMCICYIPRNSYLLLRPACVLSPCREIINNVRLTTIWALVFLRGKPCPLCMSVHYDLDTLIWIDSFPACKCISGGVDLKLSSLWKFLYWFSSTWCPMLLQRWGTLIRRIFDKIISKW